VACKKGYNSPSLTGNVSNAEAADIVAGSLSANANGMASVSDDATADAVVIVTLNPPCGYTKTDSISRQNIPGSPYVYSYSLKYAYTLNCNANNKPDNITGNLIFGGNYSGPNITAVGGGTTVFTIAGLSPTALNFVVNGEYKRTGSFQSKIDTTNHGNSNVDLVVSGLTLSKPHRIIVSGSATITVTGEVPKKGSFSFTGTIVFNGDGTANLTLNGLKYLINLATGVRTRV
jgi:hypothetical protein